MKEEGERNELEIKSSWIKEANEQCIEGRQGEQRYRYLRASSQVEW